MPDSVPFLGRMAVPGDCRIAGAQERLISILPTLGLSPARVKPVRLSVENPGAIIDAVVPIYHNWLNAPDEWFYSFPAQEFAKHLPQAVVRGVDPGKVVPICGTRCGSCGGGWLAEAKEGV